MASPSPEARTVLIDGSGYIFRAFYGIRHLSTSEGHPTNATYGFVQMLVRLLWDVQAERVVVVFDAPGPTFRNERYPEYKAHRKPMPEELRPQLPDIRAMVDAFGIPRVEQVGFEADDLIATYAEEARAAGLVPIAVVSGDKDLLQLVAPDLVMWDTMKEVVYDRAGAEAKLGVPPERVTDFLGLAGDSSDNIPGIRGIGPKSAVKLLAEFGSLDGVFAAAPEAWGKMQKKLSVEGARESAFLSRELATVMRDVPVAKPLTALVPRPPDLDQLARLFQRFEFHRLVDRVPGLRARMHALELPPGPPKVFAEPKALAEAVRALGPGPALVLAQNAEAPPEAREPELAVLCAATPARTPALVIPHLDREWVAALHAALRHAAPVLHSSKVLQRLFIGHGLSPIPVGLDALLASYLLDPGSNRHGPADLAQQAAIPVGPAAAQVPARGTEAAIAQAALIARLAPDLARRVESAGMAEHLRAVETPLAAVLARMEHAGMPVDPEVLADLASELADEAALVACALHEELGFWFNVGSPKQVGEVLFDRLGLEPVRRTQKSGSRSTDSAVLEKLSASHPAPEKILAWRNIMKLKGTYADSLPALVCPETGRIHTTLHQAVAATGRLSSSDPNLQNIPVRTEVGRRIRRAFRAPRGRGFLSVDYSQIDLRVLAHLSRDPGLCAAFREGADIHTQTAAMLFEISPDQVTKDQRRQAKAVNFGIIYGMGPQRLSRELHIAMKEARALIDRYFARFARVRGFFDEVLEGARARGFVETLLGRRRNLPILQKAHGRGAEVRAAERMAMNTPVQGGSADILRLAMLAVDAVLSARFPDCVAVLQIHDELLFEGPWERL